MHQKRMKEPREHLIQCKRVLTALASAPTRSERTNVLKFACSTFGHKDRVLHDLEIEAGVASTLSAHLRRTIDDGEDTKEAGRLCKLLFMVYQCSDEAAAQSLCKDGYALIPLLFKLLSRCSSSGAESKYVERLLRSLSSIEVALPSMENHKKILTLLLGTVRSNQQADNATMVVNPALSLLAGLAAHRDSKAIMMGFSGLFKTVVGVASKSMVVDHKYQSARILNRLAWYAKNRAPMARTKQCIDALIEMSSNSDQASVQLEALIALHLLSIESENKPKLVTAMKGQLVPSLVSAVGTGNAEKTRVQALNTLLNLISRETFKSVGPHEGLINTVASLSTSQSESDAVATLAAQCMKRLATHVQVKDKCHDGLIRAIIRMSQCERKVVKQWAAKAFLDQSAVSSNSFYIVRDEEAMKSVVCLISCPFREVKEPALETIVNLSEHRSSAKKLASSNDLLAALVRSIDEHENDDDAILRRHAVQAILSLVSHRSSTKRIAKHLGLVAALSRYGIAAQDNDVELKRAALHGVIVMAPFL